MSIDTELRATTPTHLPPLDHARLQRAGRQRRHAAYAGVVTAAVAVGGLGIAAVTTFASPPPEATPLAPPTTAPEGAPTTESATPDTDDRATPDPDVVAEYGDLSHDQMVTELLATLAATPERPTDLVSIREFTTATSAGTREVDELRGDETWEDFAVVSVVHPDFDPTGDYETPAFLPTWEQDTARLALETLSNSTTRQYAGVATDGLGRTILVFESKTSDQEVHVDPASGYTTGVYVGEVMYDDNPDLPRTETPADRGAPDGG